MKFVKILTLTIAAAFAVFFSTACKDSPGEVAQKWFRAVADNDLETASKYGTANSQQMIPFLHMALGLMGPLEDLSDDLNRAFDETTPEQEAEIKAKKAKRKAEAEKAKEEALRNMRNAKVSREEIDGDTAKVWFLNEDGEEGEPITLVKVDGDWKVDIKKD